MWISRSAFGYGNGRSTTRSSSVKIVVAAPSPSASVTMAMKEKDGERASVRAACRVSRLRVSMMSICPSPLQNAVVDRARFAAICVVVAEPASRFALGGVARQVFALHELLDATLEMKAELVVELFVGAPARAGQSEARVSCRRRVAR